MIANAPTTRSRKISPQFIQVFETMLPAIRRVACYSFRHAPQWQREELISDTVAKAYVAYVDLVARGRSSLAYPTVLAGYAIRQIRSGRQVGASQNVQDVLSPLAQRKKGFSIRPLIEDATGGRWEDHLVEDRKANPADVAACRVDFRDWLGRLKRFKRRVALRLAAGDTTSDAARYFRLSLGRVSQLRQELRENWNAFQAVPGAV
jgi:hypothetical protein